MSTATATIAESKKKADETIEALEATGEFDHGVDAFSGDGIHHGSKNHPPAPQMHMPNIHIKPKEMIFNAEKAIEKVIESVGEKMESARKGAAESMRDQGHCQGEQTSVNTVVLQSEIESKRKKRTECCRFTYVALELFFLLVQDF